MPRRQRNQELDSVKTTTSNQQQHHTVWLMNGGAGSINNLTKQRVDSSQYSPLESNQVVIRVKAIGLNFADLFSILGLYSATPKGEFCPGLEVAGEVIDKGSDVDRNIEIGSRVFGCTRFGGFATRLNLDQRYVRRLPDDWSYEEGASFLCQALTAFFGLKTLGGLRQGQTVLIHSAAGGTGFWSLRFAQLAGAHPIGTVSSQEKVDALIKKKSEGGILENPLPLSAVINRSSCGSSSSELSKVLKNSIVDSYSEQLPKSRLEKVTFDLVFDSLLGDWFKPAWDLLEPMGRHVVLGAGSMTPSGSSVNWFKLAYQYLTRPMIDPLETISLNKSFLAFNLIWLYERYEQMSPIMDEMFECLKFENGGRFGETTNKSKKKAKNAAADERPVVGNVFKFSELPDAIRHFQSGKTIGKVVVVVEEGDE